MKRRGGIGQSKRDDCELEVPIVGPEGCLPFVAILDAHAIVRIVNIKFGEVPDARELIEGHPDQGQGVPILLCDQVKTPIVDAKAKASMSF
jgi:hypothetical protein